MSNLEKREFRSVIGKLQDVMPGDELNRLQPSGPAAVYDTLSTVWLMILQRLGGGLSMKAVVKDALLHGSEFFPQSKRVRERTLSHRDTAFSDARQRLKLETVTQLLESVSTSFINAYASLGERSVFIVDGTTLTTSPTNDLKQAFPPARNQFGESVWPTVMMLVAHELRSGCALVPEIGAMHGESATSESKLFKTLAQRLPQKSIVLADSGFGIFGPVWDSVQSDHSLAFRLTKQRYASMVKSAKPLPQSGPGTSHSLTWKPTKKNRNTRPDLPSDATLDVVLHAVAFSEVLGRNETTASKKTDPSTTNSPNKTNKTGTTLYLVTTPDISREQAIELYLRRYDVEHDIRDVKVTLNTERIRAKSAEMFKKELLTSLVAYNLVVQFRREAAVLANVAPRRLSFTDVWNTFQSFFLKQSPVRTSEEWELRYARALEIASKEVLRHRPNRSYPRAAHPRRPKTTKSQKKQRKRKPN